MDTLVTVNAEAGADVFPTDRVYGTVDAIRSIMPYADIQPAPIDGAWLPTTSFALNREDIIHIVQDEVKRILLSIPQFSNINVDDFL